MKLFNAIAAVSCLGTLGACESTRPINPPAEKFVDNCSQKSASSQVVPRFISTPTTDEKRKVFTVVFEENCSYEFLTNSANLESYEDFFSFYWNMDPFVSYPHTRKFIDSIKDMSDTQKSNIYIFNTVGVADDHSESRSVVFQGSSIVVNETTNRGDKN